MMLAGAFAILVAPPGASTRRLAFRLGQPAFVVQVALVGIVSFSVVNLRGMDPSWTARVDAVRTNRCTRRPGSTAVAVPNLTFPLVIRETSRTGNGPVTVRLKPAPNGFSPLKVHCSNLR